MGGQESKVWKTLYFRYNFAMSSLNEELRNKNKVPKPGFGRMPSLEQQTHGSDIAHFLRVDETVYVPFDAEILPDSFRGSELVSFLWCLEVYRSLQAVRFSVGFNRNQMPIHADQVFWISATAGNAVAKTPRSATFDSWLLPQARMQRLPRSSAADHRTDALRSSRMEGSIRPNGTLAKSTINVPTKRTLQMALMGVRCLQGVPKMPQRERAFPSPMWCADLTRWLASPIPPCRSCVSPLPDAGDEHSQ